MEHGELSNRVELNALTEKVIIVGAFDERPTEGTDTNRANAIRPYILWSS